MSEIELYPVCEKIELCPVCGEIGIPFAISYSDFTCHVQCPECGVTWMSFIAIEDRNDNRLDDR